MDLNICLYCEKHLSEESMSFCSTLCETNEATKPMYYSSRLLNSRTTTNTSSEVYRRLSFSSSSSSSSTDTVKHTLSSSYLLTHSSILLYQRTADPKNNHQNVYSNYFFT